MWDVEPQRKVLNRIRYKEVESVTAHAMTKRNPGKHFTSYRNVLASKRDMDGEVPYNIDFVMAIFTDQVSVE